MVVFICTVLDGTMCQNGGNNTSVLTKFSFICCWAGRNSESNGHFDAHDATGMTCAINQ